MAQDLSSMRIKDLKKIIIDKGLDVPPIVEKSELVEFVENLLKTSNLLIEQLLVGKEIANVQNAKDDVDKMIWGFAGQMVNFQYVIGDKITKEVYIIDPAWDPLGLIDYCKKKGYIIKGAILTHYHVDHAGGTPPPPFNFLPVKVKGVREVIGAGYPVYVHEDDLGKLVAATGIAEDTVTTVKDQHKLQAGNVEFRCIHTPGHTRGSMIIVCDEHDFVITGDTIFPGSCGKLEEDWPDSCKCMHASLMNLSDTLVDSMTLYPGHKYGPAKSTVGREKKGILKKCSFKEFQLKLSSSPKM